MHIADIEDAGGLSVGRLQGKLRASCFRSMAHQDIQLMSRHRESKVVALTCVAAQGSHLTVLLSSLYTFGN
jgi:hypothetical protein